jgi:hypothetical protein
MTEPRRSGGPPAYDQRQLALIRLSLFLGVAMFVGVTYVLHRQGGIPAGPLPDGIRYLPVAAITAGLIALFPLRALWSRETKPAKRITISVMGWASGEAAALGGCVYYFATDDPKFAIVGIFVLLAAFMLFPIRRPD